MPEFCCTDNVAVRRHLSSGQVDIKVRQVGVIKVLGVESPEMMEEVVMLSNHQ